MAKSKQSLKAAEPAWPAVAPPGHLLLAVTAEALGNIVPRLSAAAQASLLYIPADGDRPGYLQYPEAFADEIAAIDADDVRPALVAYARELRWLKEIGGIIVEGVPIATDDRSKIMIVGARVAAQVDPAWSTVWQGSDGKAYPVTGAAMVAISDAVHAHVNATFTVLATVLAAIDAGEISERSAIETAFG